MGHPAVRRALSTAAAISLLAGAPVPAQTGRIDGLSWLAGCWVAEGAEAGSGEHWMPLAGGTMLGVARTVKGGRTVSWEFMQIREVAAGRVEFVAQPGGQRETTFVLARAGDDEVTFENLQHDFPQRITYRLQPGQRLAARIEGLRNGTLRSLDFPLRRSACETLAK